MALWPALSANSAPSLRRRWWLIVGFVPVVLVALGADSRFVLEMGVDAQWFSNVAGPLYLLLMLRGLRTEQQYMALVFVPFSALGEYIFSLIFQLYRYKFGAVPFYVPFGHAILFSTGLLIVGLPIVQVYEQRFRRVLLVIHIALFSGALLVFHDSLSAVFGVVFGCILWRKRDHVLYLVMGFLVLYIEIVGTVLGCWVWNPTPWGFLQTTNPPVGAFVCYVIADILVIKITRRLTPFMQSWAARWQRQADAAP